MPRRSERRSEAAALLSLLSLLSIVVACGEAVEVGSERPARCASDAACDDGVFCNGVERCMPGAFGSDELGCLRETVALDDGDACTADACDEGERAVRHTPISGCTAPECASDVDCANLAGGMCEVGRCVGGSCVLGPADEGAACDDGVACTRDVCDGQGACVSTALDSACFDALYCNGLERCAPGEPGADAEGCVPGEAPVAEDDGIACTVSACDEEGDVVAQAPTAECACATPGEPCADPDPDDCLVPVCAADYTCVDERVVLGCGCAEDADCSGVSDDPCVEGVCDPGTLECVGRAKAVGAACDDGIACTVGTACDEAGACLGTLDDGSCDDGMYCTGVEMCAPEDEAADGAGCVAGPSAVELEPDQRACAVRTCDEEADRVDVDASRCGTCEDATIYSDADADGYGDDSDGMLACLEVDEQVAGYVREGGDCGPVDPWRNPEAEEICGDWLDDDCDAADEACPTTMPGVEVPAWDCMSTPAPSNVYAFAQLGDGGGYYRPGGCVVVFRASSGAFYFARRNVTPARSNLCGSFDERLYAFTLQGATADCAPILIEADFSGRPELAMQPVSNACRKFLHAMTVGGSLSYITSSVETLDHRLSLYPSLEIACSGYRGWPYGWRSLLVAPFERNAAYAP